jgi:hypothetical protein
LSRRCRPALHIVCGFCAGRLDDSGKRARCKTAGMNAAGGDGTLEERLMAAETVVGPKTPERTPSKGTLFHSSANKLKQYCKDNNWTRKDKDYSKDELLRLICKHRKWNYYELAQEHDPRKKLPVDLTQSEKKLRLELENLGEEDLRVVLVYEEKGEGRKTVTQHINDLLARKSPDDVTKNLFPLKVRRRQQ